MCPLRSVCPRDRDICVERGIYASMSVPGDVLDADEGRRVDETSQSRLFPYRVEGENALSITTCTDSHSLFMPSGFVRSMVVHVSCVRVSLPLCTVHVFTHVFVLTRTYAYKTHTYIYRIYTTTHGHPSQRALLFFFIVLQRFRTCEIEVERWV